MIYNDVIKIWREKDKEDLLNKFFIKYTYCSNRIENSETSLRDVELVFNSGEINSFKGDKKTIKEIEDHRKLCQDIFKINKKAKVKLTMEIIEQVWFVLTGVKIVRDVYGSINELIQDINNMRINDDNALEVVSYFYCYFQTISKCDGRVSRILINYLLVANNLPPINIFYFDKKEYYLALEFFLKKQKIDKMVAFLDKEAYKTWIKDYNLKVKRLKDFLDD